MAYLIYNIQDADASPFLTGFKSFEKTINDIPQYIKTKEQRNNIVYDAENGEKKNRNDIISMKIPFIFCPPSAETTNPRSSPFG